VAHIPGGSGNGLAHSCGLHDPLTAAYAAVKGVTSALDVASVLQPPGRRLYLALSLTYGLLSNLDVGTEHLRWMGDLRFTLGGLKVGGHGRGGGEGEGGGAPASMDTLVSCTDVQR
jgi:sphingosine kinase